MPSLRCLWVPGLLLVAGVALLRPTLGAPEAARDRSPADLALSADGRWVVTANSTSGSASLVDLEAGQAVAEVPTGGRPFAVALSRDGRRAVVTNWLSGSLTVLEVKPPQLRVLRTLSVGDEPRGVALTADGARAFVALAGEAAVAVVDLQKLATVARVVVGEEPWHVGLSADGKRLAVSNSRSRDVSVVDVPTLKLLYSVPLRGHNLRHVAMSADGAWAYVPHIADRGLGTTRQNIDNGWVVASRLSRVPLREEGPREAIALDPRGKAVGDVDGVALSPDGATVALTAGGTHELLLLRQPLPFLAYGGPADHIDPDLLADAQRFRRVTLGGRPLGAAFTPDGRRVVVANYLANALQVVDVAGGQVSRTIPLGGAEQPSLARRGEAIFYDAGRSFNQWYSCHSCHTDGHTNGDTFDTFNDGRYGNPKKVLSLRGVAQTGPWTWHGWQTDLRESVHNSLTKSMQGPEPAAEDLDALMAYLGTLDFPPPRHRAPDGSLTPAAKRGEAVFTAKGCANCHAPPTFTTPRAFVVGLESPDDVYKGFNPPSLRGVGSRAPYLHDARAATLEEVLTRHHRPSQLTSKPDLTPQELAGLVAYLRSL
jgi:YVTN family beta-propeller protein